MYLQPRQWGFWQCWTALRDKHCRHPIAVMGVDDTFAHCLHSGFFSSRVLEAFAMLCFSNKNITKDAKVQNFVSCIEF